MAKFNKGNKDTTTNSNTTDKTLKGTPRVTSCNFVNLKKCPWLTAFVSCVFEGTVFMQSIAVRENAEGDSFITFPNKKRVNKDGEAELDKDGKIIYDAYYGPADAETRKKIEHLIFEAVQNKFDGKEAPKTEKGEDKVMVNLVNGKEGLVAMVNVVCTGKFFMTGISVNEVQNGENAGDVYLKYPSRQRLDKDGNPKLDNDGKKIYDSYFGPATSEANTALTEMICNHIQKMIDEEENK